MSEWPKINGAELDRWITGNYGEDQQREPYIDEDEPHQVYEQTCRRCGETFELDEPDDQYVCERCQYDDWHERENEQ